MDDQRTDRERGGMKHPIELMGRTHYTWTVQLVLQLDGLLDDTKGKHTTAVEAGDRELAEKYSQGMEWVIQTRASWEKKLRAMSSGNDSDPTR